MTEISIQDLAFKVQNGAVAQHDRFWNKLNRGEWEIDTFRVVDAHVDAETLAVDCGAWIGPTVLYTAQRAGLCLAFEPDPVAHEILTRNAQLNADAPWVGKLNIFNLAIHSSGAPIQIAAAGSGGNSMTSALNVNAETAWTVQTRRLQDVLAEYRGPFKKVFVKIDVEGGEYDILPSISEVMADDSVSFLISFHHRRLKLALENKHGTLSAAGEELSTILDRIVDALPWQRCIRTVHGNVLQRKEVEQAARKGRSFAMDVLIS